MPLAPDRECLIVPRFAIDGLLTALHLQLDHPSEHQLKSVVNRYMYALDMPKAVERATKSYHMCASLQKSSKALVEQSTGDPPENMGILFAADVMRRERQLVLVVREYVSSFTVTKIVESEKQSPLEMPSLWFVWSYALSMVPHVWCEQTAPRDFMLYGRRSCFRGITSALSWAEPKM